MQYAIFLDGSNVLSWHGDASSPLDALEKLAEKHSHFAGIDPNCRWRIYGPLSAEADLRLKGWKEAKGQAPFPLSGVAYKILSTRDVRGTAPTVL
ncbi:hypothetical protein MAMC_01626 [Methylacidimicrobium cyclopophantes]|uniref:NYN domain-containing protein n=1 Tax=Methylacidimicrobium cyclopophantes TaxID=1041766 RepID=A0A5E6ME34_9BACT|nr:hypothetical protein [Methylacidimicrobium cyclopophantes]VVM07464.1 hypothetical protein MAMC_01626 [Methylacidimicrobium cyclopophantes]